MLVAFRYTQNSPCHSQTPLEVTSKLILDWNLVSTKNSFHFNSSFRPRPLSHVHVHEAPVQQLSGDERVVEVRGATRTDRQPATRLSTTAGSGGAQDVLLPQQ
jgi:hypothetical protein